MLTTVDKNVQHMLGYFFVRLRINSPKVIHQVFQTEVVVVNLESGIYYSVAGAGIEIWRRLEAGVSRGEIMAAYSGDENVERFLEEITREDLVVPDESAEVTGGVTEVSRNGSFVPPKLERYDDMRDLLLLDPIHELDENGWPRNLPPLAK